MCSRRVKISHSPQSLSIIANYYETISGECWSDAPGSYDVNTFTPSMSCISDDYQQCGRLDRQCVGKQWTNFVFELGEKCPNHHVLGGVILLW